jgi:hypothetical protein
VQPFAGDGLLLLGRQPGQGLVQDGEQFGPVVAHGHAQGGFLADVPGQAQVGKSLRFDQVRGHALIAHEGLGRAEGDIPKACPGGVHQDDVDPGRAVFPELALAVVAAHHGRATSGKVGKASDGVVFSRRRCMLRGWR